MIEWISIELPPSKPGLYEVTSNPHMESKVFGVAHSDFVYFDGNKFDPSNVKIKYYRNISVATQRKND